MVDGAPRFRPEEPHDTDTCPVCGVSGDASAMGRYWFRGELRDVHIRCAARADLDAIDQWLDCDDM
jgi:hypothetical protein